MYEDANPNLLVFPEKTDFDDALELINRMQHGNILDTYEVHKHMPYFSPVNFITTTEISIASGIACMV